MTVTLAASDDASGLRVTRYILDGGDEQKYVDPFTIDSEGPHTVEYWSVDNAGNKETSHLASVRIDKTAPTTVASAVNADTTTYTFGTTTNQSVTITLTASDNPSGAGLRHTRYRIDRGDRLLYVAPFTISADGSHTIQFWSRDLAHNREVPQSVTVVIDATGPTISGAPTTSPNSNGWYNAAVTIHWTCADPGGSGVAVCPPTKPSAPKGRTRQSMGRPPTTMEIKRRPPASCSETTASPPVQPIRQGTWARVR